VRCSTFQDAAHEWLGIVTLLSCMFATLEHYCCCCCVVTFVYQLGVDEVVRTGTQTSVTAVRVIAAVQSIAVHLLGVSVISVAHSCRANQGKGTCYNCKARRLLTISVDKHAGKGNTCRS